MPKANGMVILYLDPANLNQVLIRPVHRGPTLNDILTKHNNVRLIFGVALVGNMLQQKIDEVFNDMPNVFGIANDILVVGYEDDGRDHDERV